MESNQCRNGDTAINKGQMKLALAQQTTVRAAGTGQKVGWSLELATEAAVRSGVVVGGQLLTRCSFGLTQRDNELTLRTRGCGE